MELRRDRNRNRDLGTTHRGEAEAWDGTRPPRERAVQIAKCHFSLGSPTFKKEEDDLTPGPTVIYQYNLKKTPKEARLKLHSTELALSRINTGVKESSKIRVDVSQDRKTVWHS